MFLTFQTLITQIYFLREEKICVILRRQHPKS